MEREEVVTNPQPPPPTGFPPGALLGNYRLDSLLASGLSSEVYAAVNLVAQKRCCVKIFRRGLLLGPVPFGRYVHEAQQVARLGHPNITDVFTFGTAEGRSFAAIEQLEGTSLRALVRKNAPLSKRTFLPLLRGICNGLAAAHASGIAHQHLHGGQILVGYRGHEPEVKLLDFGLHHLQPPPGEERPELPRGPEHAICIAPEQAKGQPGDARSDVYALAVLLYEMATGRVPFLADSFAGTLEGHLGESPVPPGRLVSLAPELEEVILRGLEKDPRRRIPSVEAFLATLDPISLTVTGQHQLSVTGQHQLPRPGSSWSGRLLTVSPAPERRAPGAIDPGDDASLDQLELEEDTTPPPLGRRRGGGVSRRGRLWLFLLLGVVAVACTATIAVLLLSGGDPPAPRARPRPPAVGTPSPRIAPHRAPGKAGIAPLEGIARATGYGTLQITSAEPRAQVFVNGQFRGQGRVVTIPNFAAGTHRIHLVADGKKSPHRDIELKPGERKVVEF